MTMTHTHTYTQTEEWTDEDRDSRSGIYMILYIRHNRIIIM